MDMREAEREERRRDIRESLQVMTSPFGLAITVNVEDTYLLTDAVRSYVGGADAATIFCVHATCERDLAAYVAHSEAAPKAAHRWGLGGLLKHLASRSVLPEELSQRLQVLNDHRKTLYHYGHSESDTALRRRTSDYIETVGEAAVYHSYRRVRGPGGGNKDVYNFAMDLVLRRSALESLTTGFVLRSWLAGSYASNAKTPPTSP